MEIFFRQLKLSDNAINLYFKCLGNSPRTYQELCIFLSDLTPEQCEESIGELINYGLLVQIEPESTDILSYYKIQPPISLILHHYENMSTNLDKMKEAIQQLIQNTVSNVFKDKNQIEMDTIFNHLKEAIDDINEDTLLEKQEIEDIVLGMEGINVIKELFFDFKKSTNTTIQNEFIRLIKTLQIFKKGLLDKLHLLELKKKEDLVNNLLEEEFKTYSESLTVEFTGTFFKIIEDNYKSTKGAIEKSINTMFQYRNEFKMLLLNMISNFEKNMNSIFEILGEHRDKLENDLLILENNVMTKINSIILKSIDQVSEMNNPIVDVLNQYLEKMINQNKIIIGNLWNIDNKVKLDEEISNILNLTKESLTFIIPKIEDFLQIEEIQKIPSNIKINIASSDPSTNSKVKKIQEQKNLQFKQLQNKNLVICKSDENYIIIGQILDGSNDPLNDFIGFGCNYPPLINILNKIIENFWSGGQIESFKPLKKQLLVSDSPKKTSQSKFSRAIQSPPPINSFSEDLKKKISLDVSQNHQVNGAYNQTPTIKSTDVPPEKFAPNIKNSVLKSESGKLINEAFNKLISNLDKLKGDEFSRELDDIARLILEKKGFSVTLYNLRSCINNYKEYDVLLNETEKQQIIDAIESWKLHLLK